jgi:hypothetical protein
MQLENAGATAFANLSGQLVISGYTPTTTTLAGISVYELAYAYGGVDYTLTMMTITGDTLTLAIEPDDPSSFNVWPLDNVWTVFNLSGLTQPAQTTVYEVTESDNMVSVKLNNISQTVYEDLLNRIITLLGSSPSNSVGNSSTQAREDTFMILQGSTPTLIVNLEMDGAYDEITVTAVKY